MALHKQDIFRCRLDTLPRSSGTSSRFSIGRMRSILDPAASAVNKNNNKKSHRERHSMQPRVFGFGLLKDGGVGVFPAGEFLR